LSTLTPPCAAQASLHVDGLQPDRIWQVPSWQEHETTCAQSVGTTARSAGAVAVAVVSSPQAPSVAITIAAIKITERIAAEDITIVVGGLTVTQI
jgi:hypothetical protein